MSYDESPITNHRVVVSPHETRVDWDSSAPAGSWYQVYVGSVHVASTRETFAIIPTPGAHTTVHVGVVAAADRWTDFSASLGAVPGSDAAAALAWYGGLYVTSTLAGFNIYRSLVAGGPVSFAAPVAFVPAYPSSAVSGAGMGPAGMGGAGSAAARYTYDSPRLGAGVWTFAVAAVDAAGNVDPSPPTQVVTIAAAPRPPERGPMGRRLSVSVDPATLVPTLTWLPSPPG